jgi:hypothetical protein
MDPEEYSIKMDKVMKEVLLIIKNMDLDFINGLIILFIKVCMHKIKKMD